MDKLLQTTLAHLQAMVAIDTQNQSGNSDATELFAYIKQQLSGFEITQQGKVSDGDMTLHAVRGKPVIVVNVHVDTVPAGRNWTQDPFKLSITEDRAIGLGACDIKGALACWLTAVEQFPNANAGLLLCSDEEAGGSRGIRRFLETTPDYQLAMIAEPTHCQAVTAHRGYASAKLNFSTNPGHSSDPRALRDNAIHQASRFLVDAQKLAEAHNQQTHPIYSQLRGICLNAGRIEGGTKNNIIAADAELSFGCRPLPGQSATGLLDELQDLPSAQSSSNWQTMAADPALPAGPSAPDASPLIEALGLTAGEPVSFWTEAALFSQAGIPALVCGPGDIAQAHTADEWVSLQMLRQMTGIYLNLLGNVQNNVRGNTLEQPR